MNKLANSLLPIFRLSDRKSRRAPLFCLVVAAITGDAAALEENRAGWQYGSRGLEWANGATGSYLWLGLRGQVRDSNNRNNLVTVADFDEEEDDQLRMNRSRYKVGAGYHGHATFYHEYDLRGERLLDLRATWTPTAAFHLRAGQWKSEFNRERIDSSGKQQFVERSLATYWFTVDRQWGAMASGRVAPQTAMDSSWWLGVLGGNGRSTEADGGRPMLLGRWQWNYTRDVLPFSQSALKRYEEPRASLSLAGIANDSAYTRYSSAGGGQLPGYSHGDDNQYRLYQLMQEWAWQHGGLSFQQELHYKSVEDRDAGDRRHFWGGYAQTGWFPASRWTNLPEQWEIAARIGYVDTQLDSGLDISEITVASNWFFNGHRNKLTLDVSLLESQEHSATESEWRWRLQWDISI